MISDVRSLGVDAAGLRLGYSVDRTAGLTPEKSELGLFACYSCMFRSQRRLTEIVVAGRHRSSTSEELVLAVVMAVFAVAVLSLPRSCSFLEMLYSGGGNAQHLCRNGVHDRPRVRDLCCNRLADSWSLRIQIISLYMAMMVALAILWLPKGRWSPDLPTCDVLSADLLLTSVFDVPQLLPLPGGSRHGFSSNSA
ncbi:MAG: hypothetical protein R2849_09815 [Thermomicrobiales bacterium]